MDMDFCTDPTTRMELVLLLSTLIKRFDMSVPEGCKLPSEKLSGKNSLVQPEQYRLALHRRAKFVKPQAINALQ